MQKDAEANLPKLSDKEGIIVEMRDVFSLQSWSFKYKLVSYHFSFFLKNDINYKFITIQKTHF